MFQDVRFALRSFRRSPGFTVLAVMCLTLGIGATTAVFSWIEGILLRPFPLVKHQDRMVALTGTDRSGRTDVSWPDFQDLRRNCRLIEAFVAEHIGGTTLSIGDRAERATGSVVSANYFEALGVRPILGRTFTASEESGRNAHPVAVISYDAWKNRYGGDRNIIGRTQMLNAVKYTIIGVAPEGFAGTFVGYSFQFWVPASMEEAFEGGAYKLEDRGARWIEGFAVLRPGVTMDQAQQEISAMGARLAAAYPATNRARGFQLYPLWRTPFNQAGSLFPTLRISLVVACMVLFIACANVANLLLVRSVTRRRELTVRLSVGAARWRLLKLLLTEGLLLAAAGAAGGALVPGPSADIIPADAAWRDHQHARADRLARACHQRLRFRSRNGAVWADPSAANQEHRSCLGAEVGGERRSRGLPQSVAPFQPGCPSGFAELCSAGGRGPAAEEHARDGGSGSRLFDARRSALGHRHGFGGVQPAAHARFSGPVDRPPAGRQWIRVRRLDRGGAIQLPRVSFVADRGGWIHSGARRAAYRGIQQGRAGVPEGAGRPAGVRPRIHAR